jgi:hypothetical protein
MPYTLHIKSLNGILAVLSGIYQEHQFKIAIFFQIDMQVLSCSWKVALYANF